jgi:hypothetical protein
MRRGPVVFASAMLAVGVGYEWLALRMPRGTAAYPGPGLYPVLVGSFLIVTALWCLLKDLRKDLRKAAASSDAAEGAGGGGFFGKTFQLTALTAAFVVLLTPVGYPIAMCAFLAVAIRVFGYRRWLRTVAMATVITAVSYVSFVVWLKVPLPMGLLADLLG